MRCRCCDTTNQTYFLKDGFYCRKCIEVIKDVIKDYRIRDTIPKEWRTKEDGPTKKE